MVGRRRTSIESFHSDQKGDGSFRFDPSPKPPPGPGPPLKGPSHRQPSAPLQKRGRFPPQAVRNRRRFSPAAVAPTASTGPSTRANSFRHKASGVRRKESVPRAGSPAQSSLRGFARTVTGKDRIGQAGLKLRGHRRPGRAAWDGPSRALDRSPRRGFRRHGVILPLIAGHRPNFRTEIALARRGPSRRFAPGAGPQSKGASPRRDRGALMQRQRLRRSFSRTRSISLFSIRAEGAGPPTSQRARLRPRRPSPPRCVARALRGRIVRRDFETGI